MKSVMSHKFSNIPDVKVQRSTFNRSHGLKTAFNSGLLIPFFVDEALPGDTMNLKASLFGRMATQLVPVMDNIFVDTFFFAVPNRLLWDNWEKFNGAQDNPDDSTDFTIPYLDASTGNLIAAGFQVGSLWDYLGLPTDVPWTTAPRPKISAFWSRAYNLIYNTWFRDENLLDSVLDYRGNGPDDITAYTLKRRAKRHDYFTSCLPWPQKGNSVTLPLAGTAPVTGIGKYNQIYNAGTATVYETAASASTSYSPYTQIDGQSDDTVFYVKGTAATGGYPQIYANLSQATGATINALRQAFQIQRLLERDARGGTRYIEILRSHFGVESPDYRLQRPEYLGGGRTTINVNPIAQTSESGTTKQGNLAAMATLSAHNHGFTKSFVEHCTLLGLVCVTADLTYQQGINKMFTRQTRWDFYWPSLANIGEQVVTNQEIYFQGAGSAVDEDVFGYQERYAEYRYKPSQITGVMRSTASSSLDKWHLSQEFSALPVLDDPDFIEENPPLARCIAVTNQPEIIMDVYFDFVCARPMPVYGVPGMIDHF